MRLSEMGEGARVRWADRQEGPADRASGVRGKLGWSRGQFSGEVLSARRTLVQRPERRSELARRAASGTVRRAAGRQTQRVGAGAPEPERRGRPPDPRLELRTEFRPAPKSSAAEDRQYPELSRHPARRDEGGQLQGRAHRPQRNHGGGDERAPEAATPRTVRLFTPGQQNRPLRLEPQRPTACPSSTFRPSSARTSLRRPPRRTPVAARPVAGPGG
jgi:hypothetical protein